jgi:regulator of protease activity HflC (stomatin/prohibitin superfamily)
MNAFLKSLRGMSIIFISCIFVLCVLRFLLAKDIEVGTVGVRTQEYGIFGSKGVVAKDFGPGWHRDFGPIDTWNTYDSTVQTLEMVGAMGNEGKKGSDSDYVRVQSADGYAVSVDITAKYRIKPGEAYLLYGELGSGDRYKVTIKTKTEEVCMAVFGKMRTEQFYDPEERINRQREALVDLKAILDPLHIEVIDLLMRDVFFDPAYEGKIRSKKLKDQEVEVNVSMKLAEVQRGIRQVVEADTAQQVAVIGKDLEKEIKIMESEAAVQIATIKAEAAKYSMQKKADADLSLQTAEAEGIRLVTTAEAKGEEARNLALVGEGGGTLVALEAAKNLKIDHVTVSSENMDFLDVVGMAKKLGSE